MLKFLFRLDENQISKSCWINNIQQLQNGLLHLQSKLSLYVILEISLIFTNSKIVFNKKLLKTK